MADPKTPASRATRASRASRASRESAHDVLAAEEFGVPASDPVLHHGPVRLPDDPSGIAEAHDVLAAEEFALPAPRPSIGGWTSSGRGVASRGPWLGAAALMLLALRRRRRDHRRRNRRT